MDYNLIVTCPEETKATLVEELQSFGARDIEPTFKAVACNVSKELFYELHLRLRTASRIFRVIKSFSASTPEMLYDQARRIDWPKYFSVERTYLIDGVPADRGPGAMSGNEISKRVREALQSSFEQKVGTKPQVDLKEPHVVIVAFVHKGKCMLSFDTTGKTLHKRGYRLEGHPAPIKETLAAAMLKLAGYDGSGVVFDAMCGSGTIAIEAAYIALDKSPQIHRKKGEFGFEWLADFDKDLWREVQDKVRIERHDQPPAAIIAADISAEYVDLARRNALRARVEKHIQFHVADFLSAPPPPGPPGLLIANLPYGERIGGNRMDVTTLFKAIGDKLKREYAGWRAALLVADESPHKFIGLKPKRKIPLLNGTIAAKLLIFELYSGSKRGPQNTELDQA